MAFSAAILQSVKEVLQAYKFLIPDYQRGYSWRKEQWEELWQDINNLQKSKNQQHFTGMMLLKPTGDDKKKVEVVDGQQRLITLIMLVKIFERHLKETSTSYTLEFENNEELKYYFGYYALGNQDFSRRLNTDNASTYALNIKFAHDFFNEQVNQLEIDDAKEKLMLLLSNFQLFVLEVAPEFDIHIAFETLNNRGRRLSKMELLKNRLIYLTTVIHDKTVNSNELRIFIHDGWKNIYKQLGRSLKTQKDDDEFLLAHATTYFKKKREADWLKHKLLDEEFSVNNSNLSFEHIKNYVISLEHCAAWWSHIHAPNKLPSSHEKLLIKIERAGFSYYRPLILAAYMRCSNQNSSAVSNPKEHENLLLPVLSLLTQIERCIVIVFRLLGNNGSSGKADIDNLAYKILDENRDEIKNTVEAVNHAENFVRAWIDNYQKEDGTFFYDNFKFPGQFKIEKVIDSINKRFEYSYGYYKWDFTRLVLVEYEEMFQRNGNSPVKLGWSEFKFDETVEHIYPQTPEGKGIDYWDKMFKIDGRTDKAGSLKKALKNSLGNLLFLSRSDNSSVSNNPYSTSDGSSNKKARFKNASYSATEVANEFKDWDINAMVSRGVNMLKFIEQRWNIELSKNSEDFESYLQILFGNDESVKISAFKAGKLNKKGIAKHLESLRKSVNF
ncbi:MAG: DUF262 domain-containing HNH endonuclease family protein [Methylotenera sp.]